MIWRPQPLHRGPGSIVCAAALFFVALACQRQGPGDPGAQAAVASREAAPEPPTKENEKQNEKENEKENEKQNENQNEKEDPAPPPERPLYYERSLAAADLEGRSLRELDLMRNTIYARYGQRFRKTWLSDHFSAQPWYQPQDTVDEAAISPLDLANAEAIVDHANKISAADLRDRRDALNEKMRAETADTHDLIEFQLIAAHLGEWEGGDAIDEAQRSPLEDPDRLDRLLAVDDLGELSLRDLRLLRNTIYARRGRPFRSELLQILFDDKSWYEPVDAYSDRLLTAVDRKNIRLIMSVEKELGGPISDWGHRMEEGWLYGA